MRAWMMALVALLLACGAEESGRRGPGHDAATDVSPDAPAPDGLVAFDAVDAPDLRGEADADALGPADEEASETVGPRPQDLLSTRLELDLAALEGHATLSALPGAQATSIRLHVEGLTLYQVAVDGTPVVAPVNDGVAAVPVPSPDAVVTIDVSYSFPARSVDTFDGWMPDLGVSFVWPDHCGQLFPCDPAPADGVTFTLSVTGQGDGLTAVYPATTLTDVPSYVPAVAVAPYVELALGTTEAGTELAAWYFPDPEALPYVQAGTAHLVAAFDWLERTIGPYAFGARAGSVEVDWGDDSHGGMEHHPFWHVATFDYDDEEVHVHEAAHGWYGDGVRLACWEDFVLSEGTTTYLTARALEQVGGPSEWSMYLDLLGDTCSGADVNTEAWPRDGCNAIDFESDDLWSMVPYLKGACFFEEVADLLGADRLDGLLGAFYRAHVNRAARMAELIDALEADADADELPRLRALQDDWLLTVACPADWKARCGTHQP